MPAPAPPLRPAPPHRGAIALRADQEAMVSRIYASIREGHRAILSQAQTGAGKGHCIAAMLADCASRGRRAAVVTHLSEINRDLIQRIRSTGIEPRVLMGSAAEGPSDSLIWVVSEQTAARRGLRLEGVRLCIRDEAHRQQSCSALTVAAACPPDAIHVGFTATPARGDGRPLDFYKVLHTGAQIGELVDAGLIAPMRAFSPLCRGTGLAADPVEAWPRGHGGRPLPGVLFADSVAHSRALVPAFAAAGITAVHCDAGTPNRAAVIERFNAGGPGSPDILTCWRLLQEGVDTRRAVVCMTASAIGHIGIIRQMWGRVRRLCPAADGTPKTALAIDLRDNLRNLNVHPDSDLYYSLDGATGIRVAEPVESAAFPMRCCSECWAWSRSGAPCQVCGAIVPPPPPPVLSKRALVEVLHQRQRLAGPAWEEWLRHCQPRLARGATPQKIAAAWMFDKRRPPAFTVAQAVEALAAGEAVAQARTAIEKERRA